MTIEMIESDADKAQARLDELMAPCFAEEPTAGAVILINSKHGTAFFSINMDSEEIVQTLFSGGTFLAENLGMMDNADRILQ
jgi:hypothetical protein